MTNIGNEKNQKSPEPDRKLSDDAKNLYIGRISGIMGSIKTERGTLPTIFWGEILIFGYVEDDRFIASRLRRVALYGQLAKPSDDERVGVFSLASFSTESIDAIKLQLHYAALTERLPPRSRSGDAVLPEVEQITARLSWKAERNDKSIVQLLVELDASELLDKKLGVVKRIKLGPTVIHFQLAGSGPSRPDPHYSLPSNCPTPPAGNCSPPDLQDINVLKVKFINFSTYSLTDNDVENTSKSIEDLCRDQLNEVCRIWRNKSALDLEVQGEIEEGTSNPNPPYGQKDIYSYCSLAEEGKIGLSNHGDEHYGPSHTSTTQLEIYIVNELLDSPASVGGGVTHNANVADAYCILGLNKLVTNPRLLAHELCHVVGLAHPDGTAGDIPSSWNSIAETGAPNPDAQTLHNLQVFTDATFPLNPLVVKDTTQPKDCFRVDPVDHFIRDFPVDDGSEPSPAGIPVWNKSSLWNRLGATAGAFHPDNSPDHQEPLCSGDNYMYVKLEYLGPRNQLANVDLYLGVPGLPGNLTPLVEPVPNHRIEFTPHPPYPKMNHLAWSVPGGYPSHCCAFAVAHNDDPYSDESWPFASASISFTDVWSRLRIDNDIAQRNLNIQNCSPNPTSAWMTLLYWVQTMNPFTDAKTASIKIDTSLAPDLAWLGLEVDGKFIEENIKLGGVVPINLSEALGPGEKMILRLRASLPSDQPQEKEFPIGLTFVLDGDPITGYDHIVRIAPLSATAIQVLDGVFAALRDVAIAFESDTAQTLAEEVKIVLLEHTPRRGDWYAQFKSLADGFKALAKDIEARPSDEPEYEAISQYLSLLADSFLSEEAESPHLFTEKLRELADYVQEPAGRIVRRRRQL